MTREDKKVRIEYTYVMKVEGMKIIQIDDEVGKAILEDSLGYYLAEYKVDFTKKKLEMVSTYFESELVTRLELIGDTETYYYGDEEEDFKNVYRKRAEDMETYVKVKETIGKYYFPSLDVLDLSPVSIFLVKNKKNSLYKTKISEKIEDDDINLVIKEILKANPAFAEKFIKALNSVLLMYSRSSKQPSDKVALRIVERIILSVKESFGIHPEDLLSWSEIKKTERELIEKNYAERLISSNIREAINEIVEKIVKDRFQFTGEIGWLRVDVGSTRRFNLSKFKEDHLDLYNQYLVNTESSVMRRQPMSKMDFPLSEEELRNRIAVTFKTFEKS